jgi:long-chain-fatty-acid--[acyl-carrier-protein] ligase
VATIDVDPALRRQVVAELGKRKDRAPGEIRDEWRLSSEMGFDSLEIAEVVAWLGEEFHAFDVKPEDLKTVADVQVAAAGAAKSHADEVAAPPDGWVESLPRPAIRPPDVDSTVHMNFLRLAEESPKSVVLADETSGVMSYSRMRTGVVLMADIISEYPEKHVGIMLPATAGGALLVLATLTAGKVPVMINWTVGDANFQHVVKVSEVGVILTSSKFLDKVDSLDYDNIADHIVTLEDLRKNKIGLGRKLKAVARARKSAAAICAAFGSDKTGADDTAVILFTSGSESAPKGVSLSHRNILSNIAASLDRVKLSSTDVLYGFLPPFHSFGFTMTTILPLVSGLKTAYYPNPTEARALARGIGMWKPTVLCGTPTFLSSIFRSASDAQLKSLELMLAGAEKAPAELFSAAKKRCGAEVLEGYGITECSPVITICAVGEERVGVGPPLTGITLRAVHPETREPVESGTQGLILVNGPSVFDGYLDRDSTDAFMELDGERYYVTGDLGILDEKGRLTLTGRLKRFVKIGGEMISLPAMESVIQEKIPPAEEDSGVAAALTYVEEAGERAIIALFTTVEVDSEAVNDWLRDAGFSNLARVRKVMMIDEVPLLGTGKTNYRALTVLLKESLESDR